MTRMLEVKRGTRIYLPGDPSDQIFLLKSGVIKISMTTPDNRDVILALLHAGDIFGELAVVDDAPRDHVAEAYDDCVICAMSRDTILRVIHETPEIGFQITKLIGMRLRTFRSRIEELLCHVPPVPYSATIIESTRIVPVFASSVPTTRTFCAANCSGVSWSLSM